MIRLRRGRTSLPFAILLAAGLCLPGWAAASGIRVIEHHGRLLDRSGDPLSGRHEFH